ncbi:fimbria/pilus periplasmic chaperone [Raoultella planticola]|uniref:fimbria/pilus periplasmic chaperone n=1 Tax=Raoultella planticola TaxID=575 RepID=UPI00381BD560
MSQIRISSKINGLFFTLILCLFFGKLAHADIAIDPIHIELGGAESKTQVKLYNNSNDEYVYRSGIIRRQVNGKFDKESKLYLIYPPIGLLKSNSNVELGVVKMKGSIHRVDEKIYLYIQLIPKREEALSEDLVINLTTTILVEIKRKE